MCMVSVIYDYGRDRVPRDEWTRDSFGEYRKLIEMVEALDRKLDQTECHDPLKAKWMEEVEERLRKLEFAEPKASIAHGRPRAER